MTRLEIGANVFDTGLLLPSACSPSDLAAINRHAILRPAHYLEINAMLTQSPEQTTHDGLRSSSRPGLLRRELHRQKLFPSCADSPLSKRNGAIQILDDFCLTNGYRDLARLALVCVVCVLPLRYIAEPCSRQKRYLQSLTITANYFANAILEVRQIKPKICSVAGYDGQFIRR